MPSQESAVQDLFAVAFQYHQAGRLAEAERVYRQVLGINPRHADSLHLLGVLARQVGRHDAALQLIGAAIDIDGKQAAYHANLGNVLRDLGRLHDALTSYGAALRLKPDMAEAHCNKGNALRDQGRLEDAVTAYRIALSLQPAFAQAHSNLGNALQGLGRLDDAIAAYQAALRLKPDFAEALSNLGNALRALGRLDDAVAAYDAALRLAPDVAEIHSNLANALRELGQFDAAIAACSAALRLKPDYADAHGNLANAQQSLGQLDDAVTAYHAALSLKPNDAEAQANLGNALKDLGQLDAAVTACIVALRLKPDYAEAHSTLGGALQEQGRLEAAVTSYRRALVCKPTYANAGMNLVFAHLYRTDVGLPDILAQSRGWSEKHANHFPWMAPARPSGGAGPHRDRRPRIGFVSADFRHHAVGTLVIPAIEGLARTGHHLTLYSNSAKSDELTARFGKAASVWRPVAGLSDDAMAALIRADGIDILIDLSGYSAGNRLLVFARKPAPIQVACWVGYPATTGMKAMDYILADRHQIPASAEAFYSEAVVRLPDSYIAFEPPPADDQPPVLARSEITFGSFNMLKKITPEVVAVWSRILSQVPASQVLMKTKGLTCAATQRRYAELFAAHGIAKERLIFVGGTASAQHIAWMRSADIALDPFPYAGGRTTLEALWMGIPVITLPRETFGSRHSLSYLSTIGLDELVASDVDEYVERAVTLADDKTRLAALRAGLRSRMLASPLCDIDRFSGDLATGLALMWRRWCDGQPAVSFDIAAYQGRQDDGKFWEAKE